jgi:SCF-associated factor 1
MGMPSLCSVPGVAFANVVQGNNSHSRLGHSYEEPVRDVMPRIRHGRVRMRINTHCSFPTEMENTRDLGVIADMQCG